MIVRKGEIIAATAKQTGFMMEDVKYIVDAVFDVIKNELAKDNDVQYFRFGKWQVQKSRGRHFTLPTRPGEDFYKPPCRYVRFISSSDLNAMFSMKDEIERECADDE